MIPSVPRDVPQYIATSCDSKQVTENGHIGDQWIKEAVKGGQKYPYRRLTDKKKERDRAREKQRKIRKKQGKNERKKETQKENQRQSSKSTRPPTSRPAFPIPWDFCIKDPTGLPYKPCALPVHSPPTVSHTLPIERQIISRFFHPKPRDGLPGQLPRPGVRPTRQLAPNTS